MTTKEKEHEIVTTNVEYEELKEIAKELELTVGGLKKQELVESINTKIHELAGRKNLKWYDISGFIYKDGDKIDIIDGILKGRQAIINKASNKKNAVKAFLINSKTGDRQNTNVTLDYDNIKLAKEEVEDKIKDVM